MKELTEDEINKAICKWLGWTFRTDWSRFYGETSEDKTGWMLGGKYAGSLKELPNHLTGPEALGNMHEAEKRLTDDEYGSFATTLLKSAQEEGKTNAERGRLTVSAGARQRATALLRVVKPELFHP